MIEAAHELETLLLQTDHQYQIPDSITILTSLNDVTVCVEELSTLQQSHDWLYTLTTLTALQFKARHGSSLEVSDGFTKLQRLYRFVVTASERPCTSNLNLQVNWGLMQQLIQVSFVGQKIVCDGKILSLALAESLLVPELLECMPADTVSMHNMALLAQRVSILNPHLVFFLNGQMGAMHSVASAV